jgi:predicted phage terminase large subunit-like protein
MGEYHFVSQYQQMPMPPGGNIVKRNWLKYYEPGSEPPRLRMRIFQSWDTANKATELSDYSVCTTWGIVRRNEIYLLDVFRKRLNFPELKRAVVDLKLRFKPHKILIEDKASGTQLIQELKNSGHTVTPYQPPSGTDKVMRLDAQTTFFESGCVRLPAGAPYLEEYVAEITGFPGTKFDDQVDSTTQFLDSVRSGPLPWFHLITPEVLAATSRPSPRGPYGYDPWKGRTPVFFLGHNNPFG